MSTWRIRDNEVDLQGQYVVQTWKFVINYESDSEKCSFWELIKKTYIKLEDMMKYREISQI